MSITGILTIFDIVLSVEVEDIVKVERKHIKKNYQRGELILFRVGKVPLLMKM